MTIHDDGVDALLGSYDEEAAERVNAAQEAIVEVAEVDDEQLATDPSALKMAASTRALAPRWIHHTDRDCRYGSDDYLAALEQLGARPSISRKGDCWDNAVFESVFGTLERELLALQPLQSRRDTRERVASYIESYYNLGRLHSHLDYVSPIDFETNAPG